MQARDNIMIGEVKNADDIFITLTCQQGGMYQAASLMLKKQKKLVYKDM